MMIFPNGQHPQIIPGSRVAVVFGAGNLSHIGSIAKTQGATRVLLVTDPGIKDAGHVDRAVRSFYHAGLPVRVFDEVGENPTTIHVGKGVIAARSFNPDFIIGLGGGSAMDCAKGINFLLTNGGRMQDYWGTGKAEKPMLPLIAIPTTAGTGSEAQSFAIISDPQTLQKMACGDSKALPRLALLDPDLTATQPPRVAAATGIDAVAHAVESSASTRRNDTSRKLSLESWRLLDSAFERAVRDPSDEDARQSMLLGAHLAGAAIENSMLGAAHALANPLTSLHGVIHGLAVGMMLPHVIRFNSETGQSPYGDLNFDYHALAHRVDAMLASVQLPQKLSDVNVNANHLPELAKLAATQWTATFNPRKVGESESFEIYRMAL